MIDERLLTSVDSLRREADVSGMFESMDKFDRTAFDMVTGAKNTGSIRPFQRRRRKPATSMDGHSWGQSTLLARRSGRGRNDICVVPLWGLGSSLGSEVRNGKLSPED